MKKNICVRSVALLLGTWLISAFSIAEAIEEILVTGSKRAGTVMTTPAAITAVSGEMLSARGLDELSELQFYVPSVHVGEQLGSKKLAIRGIGDFQLAPGVLVSVNGVVQSSGTSSMLSSMDLERVEVMRGPQGTLYGRNSNGGAINYIAAKPTDDVFGKVKLGFAEYDHLSIEGVYSAPISDSVGIRLAFNHLNAGEGWVDNLMENFNDQEQGEKTNFRLIVEAELSEALNAELLLGRSEVSGPWDHHAFKSVHPELANSSVGLPLVWQGSPVLLTDAPWKIYTGSNSDSNREYDIASVTLDWKMESMSVKSITAFQDWYDYFDGAADGSSVGAFQRFRSIDSQTFTQELNVSGQSGDLSWISGIFYMDDQRAQELVISLPGAILANFIPFPAQFQFSQPTYDTKSLGIFVDATYALSDSLRVGFGVRQTEDDFTDVHTMYTNAYSVEEDRATAVLNDACGGLLTTEWDESAVTMRASVEVDTSDSSMVYGSFSQGYKGGGMDTSVCEDPYRAETVDAFEIGYKATLGDGTTTLTTALFHYNYADFQVAQVVDISASVKNAGDATVDGVEVELMSNITDGLSISGGYTFLDSAYEDFLNVDPLGAAGAGVGFIQNAGNQLNNAPKHSLNVGVMYDVELSTGGNLSLSMNTSYRSRIFYREFGNLDDSQPGYIVVNANANYTSSDGTYGARFFIHNATNEAYFTDLVTSNSQYGRHVPWGMPRQVGLEVTRYFGSK